MDKHEKPLANVTHADLPGMVLAAYNSRLSRRQGRARPILVTFEKKPMDGAGYEVEIGTMWADTEKWKEVSRASPRSYREVQIADEAGMLAQVANILAGTESKELATMFFYFRPILKLHES